MPARASEGIANGYIEDQIILPPFFASQVNLAEYPALTFREPGYPEGEGQIETQDEKGKVEPEAYSRIHGHLPEYRIHMELYPRLAAVRAKQPDVACICKYRSF
jgi:hypothetical protein